MVREKDCCRLAFMATLLFSVSVCLPSKAAHRQGTQDSKQMPGVVENQQERGSPKNVVYDPLALPTKKSAKFKDVDVVDQDRGRTIPIRIYLPSKSRSKPAGSNEGRGVGSDSKTSSVGRDAKNQVRKTDFEKVPLIVFSHGLGGSRKNSPYLANHWTARGFACVFIQHPGSDESVWKNVPNRQRLKSMQKAASGNNLMLRLQDVPAVLDALESWNSDKDHFLFEKIDMKKIGMSGHSFGAVTTQSVSGESKPVIGTRFLDDRIVAALALSPSSPNGRDATKAFKSVKIPWMLMTGTRDKSRIGGQTVESRLAVYPALPKTIDRYELVLDKAQHSAFSERATFGDNRASRNPNHHRAILALSTAFWESYLKNDKEAIKWLQGDRAKLLLEEKDRWQFEKGRK